MVISVNGRPEIYSLRKSGVASGTADYDLVDGNGQRVPLGEGRWATLTYNENHDSFYLYNLGQLSNGRFVCRQAVPSYNRKGVPCLPTHPEEAPPAHCR